jgi:uncharacterized protein (DUF362 family)
VGKGESAHRRIRRRELIAAGVAGLGASAFAPAPAVVGVGTGARHLDAVERALAEVGGLDFVGAGETVLLKVNANSGDPYPYSTSPAVVGELARALAARGARVVVGDRSFWGDTRTSDNLERNGIAPAARAAGARVVVFDDAVEWIEVPPALVPSWRPPVRVPRLLRDADHVLNLACVKTHFITGFTMALKNALGLVHAADRARDGNLRVHTQDRIYAQIAELCRFVRPTLHLCDGFEALVRGGPTPASPPGAPRIAPARLVAASRDPVALDAVGVAILQRHAPPSEVVTKEPSWRQAMLRAAVAAGVGAARPGALVVRGASVADRQALATLARAGA